MSMRIKLFVALPSEFPIEKAPLGVDVIYTGVGKINAAIKATEILKDFIRNMLKSQNKFCISLMLPFFALTMCFFKNKFSNKGFSFFPCVKEGGETF